MITVSRRWPGLIVSIDRWLKTVTYDVDGVLQTLQQRFANLQIAVGYPDDLTKVERPTIALHPGRMVPGDDFFGQGVFEDLYALELYGFVLGQGTDAKNAEARNRMYRDALLNDLLQLFRAAQDEAIPLLDPASKAEVGAVDLVAVRGHLIPSNAPDIAADRHKFLVELDAAFA